MYEDYNTKAGSHEFSGGTTLKIWLRLHGFELCSWTVVWDYLGAAFADIGVELYTYTPPDDPTDCIELWWGDPQYWHWSDLQFKARVSLALSEAHSIFARGRDKTIANLNNSDLIICPSEAATTAFREAPIDVPIRVSPFGVDPVEFPYIERDWTDTLTFLHAGVTQFRKGSWLVPEAFINAFRPDDNVRLVMVSPRTTPMYTRLVNEYGSQPNIEFRSGRSDSMLQTYEESHIYVSPHLSEGFGLCPLEAMSTGMACLMARCSAPTEYFRKDRGWWIEMSEDYSPVSKCLPDTNGFWRLPDLESLIAVMGRAYMNRQECELRGQVASAYAHNEMSWELTARTIIKHIKEMLYEKSLGGNVGIQRREVVTGPSGKYIPAC